LDLPWRGEIQREFGLLIFTSYIKASLSEPWNKADRWH
jgi:hypothetical protein